MQIFADTLTAENINNRSSTYRTCSLKDLILWLTKEPPRQKSKFSPSIVKRTTFNSVLETSRNGWRTSSTRQETLVPVHASVHMEYIEVWFSKWSWNPNPSRRFYSCYKLRRDERREGGSLRSSHIVDSKGISKYIQYKTWHETHEKAYSIPTYFLTRSSCSLRI